MINFSIVSFKSTLVLVCGFSALGHASEPCPREFGALEPFLIESGGMKQIGSMSDRIAAFEARQNAELKALSENISLLKPFLEGRWGHSLYNEQASENPELALLKQLTRLDADTREKFESMLRAEIKRILHYEAAHITEGIEELEVENLDYRKGELLRGAAFIAVRLDLQEAGADILSIALAYAPAKLKTMRGDLTLVLLIPAFTLGEKPTYDQLIALHQSDPSYMPLAISESDYLKPEELEELRKILP